MSFDEPNFDISLMTYDDGARKLLFVDGLHDGGDPRPELRGFWLPFGLGLAGACFKQGDSPFFYYGDKVDEQITGPEYYLNIPDTQPHRGMIAIPLVHPEWYGQGAGETVEASRMCLGVIDIAFAQEPKWLQAIRATDATPIVQLRAACQNFGDNLWKVVR